MTSANTLEQQKMKAAYEGCDAEVKPAANVWRGPDPVSVPDQVEFLKGEGFIVLRQALDRKGVDELLLELDRLAQSHALLPRIRDGLDLEPRRGVVHASFTGFVLRSCAPRWLPCGP